MSDIFSYALILMAPKIHIDIHKAMLFIPLYKEVMIKDIDPTKNIGISHILIIFNKLICEYVLLKLTLMIILINMEIAFIIINLDKTISLNEYL